MQCPHLSDLTCHAILPITPTQETCRACSRLGKGINAITVLENIAQLRDRGEQVPEYLFNYLKKTTLSERSGKFVDPLTYGPGTNLAKLLSWFVTKPPNCLCDDRAKLMNLWGKDKCLEELPTILGWLRESALDTNTPYSEFVVTHVVKLAIRLSSNEPSN